MCITYKYVFLKNNNVHCARIRVLHKTHVPYIILYKNDKQIVVDPTFT